LSVDRREKKKKKKKPKEKKIIAQQFFFRVNPKRVSLEDLQMLQEYVQKKIYRRRSEGRQKREENTEEPCRANTSVLAE